MKKGAGVCSLNRVPWCWGISKEKPFVFYSENELFFKKGRKKKTVSVSTQEWACFILSAASWLQGMNAWPLSWTFRLKKDPFHWFKSNSCFAYLSTKSSFKKFDSRNSNISRSSSPSKSEHAFYMTETLELLTFFYIILLKKLPRNGTFFFGRGELFSLVQIL